MLGVKEMHAWAQHLVLIFIAALVAAPAQADERSVAATFSKASIYLYSEDFIYEPVTEWFSEEELSILQEHNTELNSMVRNALNFGHSVGGAALTAHFKQEENFPLLRWRLLWPGTAYGWEGPDYDSEEDYLTDNQFVYHSVYLWAIEETMGQPVYEVVQLTQQEHEDLFRYLAGPEYVNYYWAKWLARKLLLLERPR